MLLLTPLGASKPDADVSWHCSIDGLTGSIAH